MGRRSGGAGEPLRAMRRASRASPGAKRPRGHIPARSGRQVGAIGHSARARRRPHPFWPDGELSRGEVACLHDAAAWPHNRAATVHGKSVWGRAGVLWWGVWASSRWGAGSSLWK